MRESQKQPSNSLIEPQKPDEKNCFSLITVSIKAFRSFRTGAPKT